MTQSLSRRQFLSALALVGAGTGISALTMRGFRLPFMPEPRSRASEAVHPSEGFSARGEDAFFVRADDQQLEWRAFAPEPSLNIRGRFEISIDNLHPKAICRSLVMVVYLKKYQWVSNVGSGEKRSGSAK